MRPAKGVRWAHTLSDPPSFLHSTREPHGTSRREGLRYEKSLAKGLGARFRHGLWWEFQDEGGIRYCQTDFFGRGKEWIILLESKLTWTQDAEEQLWELYVPVVACALRVPRSQILPVVVCKYLTREAGSRPIGSTLKESIRECMNVSAPFCAVWHHIGGVPQLMEAA